MESLFRLLGLIGSFAFAFAGFPLALKTIKEKSADNIATGTVILWIIGILCSLGYALYFYPTDFVILANPIISMVSISIISYFKFFVRKEKKNAQSNR